MNDIRKAPSTYSVYISVQPGNLTVWNGYNWSYDFIDEPLEIEYSRWGVGHLNHTAIPQPFFMDNGTHCYVSWDRLTYAVYKCPSDGIEETLSDLEVDLKSDMRHRTERGDYDLATETCTF